MKFIQNSNRTQSDLPDGVGFRRIELLSKIELNTELNTTVAEVFAMRFTKMQGAGNDYIYVDCFAQPAPADPAELARRVADRHFGIGGDGLILICPSQVADARMRMFNADGSEGEMCGNGVRCVAKYVYDHGIARKPAADDDQKRAAACCRWSCRLRATRSIGCVLIWRADSGNGSYSGELARRD